MLSELGATKNGARRIEYTIIDDDRVLVVAHVPGEEPLKTIVEVGPPEEFESEEYALEGPR